MRTIYKNIFKSILRILLVIILFPPLSLYPFGKNKVNIDVFRWNILKTIHFDIFYPYGIEELAIKTAEICEEGYVHIANKLNHELTMIIPIIIYPSHIAFQENNILQSLIGEGTGGFTEAYKNRVVVPFTGSYYDFRHVLVHELVHAFQYNILSYDTSGKTLSRFTLGGIPLWIMEGMAEYLSIGFDETSDMVMRDVLYNDTYATLIDLTNFHVRSGYLLYKEGQAFFYFFEEIYGKGKIGEFFRDIRDSSGLAGLNEAIKISTGKTLEELSLQWIRFFKKRYYPLVKGKKFDEEVGKQLTFHQKSNSTFNVCPAVSPDGKKIAYLTNRDIYSSISILTVDKKKEKRIKTLIRGGTSSKFEGMHLLSNYLSWSNDGKYIVFISQSNGRDIILLINSKNGKVVKEIKLLFRGLRDPSLSPDGKKITFIGQDNYSSDVYVYDIEGNELIRVTDDLFSERYPSFSSDNSFLIFSSNWNENDEYDIDDYNILKKEMKSGVTSIIINSKGNDLQADISKDDNKIIYISNRTGIYNVYKYDFDQKRDQRITNILCGIFYPRWFPDGKRMAFVAYQNLGYDIFFMDLSKVEEIKDEHASGTEYMRVSYSNKYYDLTQSIFDDDTIRISPDIMMMGLGATWGYGIAGFARMSISDYLGDHRIVIGTDYYRYKGSEDVNYNAIYYYLKHRWDFGLGVFRQKNPFGLISLSTINEVIHNVHQDTQYIDYYGIFSEASYPFSKFFRFNMKATSSRYEIDYSKLSNRLDTFANLNQCAMSLNFDNVLWGQMVPIDGMRGQLQIERSFNITGQDYSFTSIDVDLRKYFLISKRYVLAFRGSAGKIFGPDSEFFKYYIGGFNSLRGHPYLGFSGRNVFLFNTEFRFAFIEGIKFGWPLFFRMGSIGGVLFIDSGSAWDEHFRFMDQDKGEFDDFKASMGFGFRLTLYPLIILKLDYAWPYYYKSFSDREIIFSMGFEY